MLDQLVAFCGNTIGENQVLEVFGLTAEHVVANLTRAILRQAAADALTIVHQQAEAGKDLTKLLGDLLAFFRNLLIYKIDPQSLREEISDHARTALEELAPVVDTKRLLRLIEGTSEVEATIKWASNKKLHLEIALIRAIQTLSEVSLDNVIDALENLRGPSGSPPVKEKKKVPRRKDQSGPIQKSRAETIDPPCRRSKRRKRCRRKFPVKQSRPKSSKGAGRIDMAANYGSDTRSQTVDCFVARTCDPFLS